MVHSKCFWCFLFAKLKMLNIIFLFFVRRNSSIQYWLCVVCWNNESKSRFKFVTLLCSVSNLFKMINDFYSHNIPKENFMGKKSGAKNEWKCGEVRVLLMIIIEKIYWNWIKINKLRRMGRINRVDKINCSQPRISYDRT